MRGGKLGQMEVKKKMFFPELKGTSLQAYVTLVNDLTKKAAKELYNINWNPGYPVPSGLVRRNLRPEDLEFTNSEWRLTLSSGSAWNAVVSSAVIDDNRFIGIYGVHNNEAIDEVAEVKITKMGKDARYWNVQPIASFENKIGYADDPITVDQNTAITISLWGDKATTLTDFSFVGVTVEKAGLVINP